MGKQTWFEVDREGLAQTVRRRHPGFIFAELIANSLDQPGTTEVNVYHKPVAFAPLIEITVTDDDPTGFADLKDAYTLFRRTPKRANATVRGRFNLGEKEFLSICHEARITTTIGSVFFYPDGTRRKSQRDADKREKGTEVTAKVKMTRTDYEKALEFLDMIVPPEGVNIVVHGEGTTTMLSQRERKVVGKFESTLPTDIEDEDGDLRRSSRKTEVHVYEVRGDRDAYIYEMGIPICALPDDKWDVNVMQKVPLARDRDSVTPAYLQKIRVGVVNNCHKDLDEDDATQAWVTEAISDKDIDKDAFEGVISSRFGEDAVIYDPSDKEANDRALAAGRQLIYGGSIPKGAHENVKRFDSAPSAGSAFPTSKAVFGSGGNNIQISMTDDMKRLCEYTAWLAQELMDVELHVEVVRSKQGFVACYGEADGLIHQSQFLYNLRPLGRSWFTSWRRHFVRVHKLIIHEFAHEYEESHLSDNYHKACCDLGAKLANLMLENPEAVNKFLREEVEA